MGALVKIGVVVTIGVVLVISSGLLLNFFPSIVEDQVSKNLNLAAQTGLPYDNWAALSLPLSMKIYLFDVQNPDEVTNHGEKPKLVEKGPYVFSETREKINITWNDEDQTASYYQTRNYKFVRSESIGDLEDTVTLANVPAIAIATMGKNESETNKKMLTGAMAATHKKNAALYITKSVREWLFDGYYDSFIEIAQTAAKKMMLPNHTFGFFYGFNGADDGRYTVYTGKDDANKYTVIKEWRGPRHIFQDVDDWTRYDKLPMWDSETHCSDINGTDGQQFPPFIKKDSILRIFISEMCRSAYVVFQKEVTHHGITAYRFVPDMNMMADPSVNPDNECFCTSKKQCMFTGAISISKCQRDAPIYATFPHFYQADPLLLRMVDGLKPDPEKHTILLDVEPLTGTPINAKRCSQVNVDMEPMFPLFSGSDEFKMPRMYHPVLWFCEEGTLDGAIADTFKEMAVNPVRIGTSVIYAVLGVGIALVVGAFAIHCACKTSKNRSFTFDLRMKDLQAKENIYTDVNPTSVSRNGNAKTDEKSRKF